MSNCLTSFTPNSFQLRLPELPYTRKLNPTSLSRESPCKIGPEWVITAITHSPMRSTHTTTAVRSHLWLTRRDVTCASTWDCVQRCCAGAALVFGRTSTSRSTAACCPIQGKIAAAGGPIYRRVVPALGCEGRRFAASTSPAANSSRNFKSKSGTTIIVPRVRVYRAVS